MNIFFLSFLPALCARMHGDKHLIKMILETAQMLCTCYRFLNGQRPKLTTKKLREKMEEEHPVTHLDETWILRCQLECGLEPYRMTHYNHGCNVWLRERYANYIWLSHLGIELCKEKRRRFADKPSHASEPLLYWLAHNPPRPSLFACPRADRITTPYIAINQTYECQGEEEDPSERVLRAYHKYYKYKEALGIVEYKRDPTARPDFLDQQVINPEVLKRVRGEV